MRPEIKVCGVSDPAFAAFAAGAGVDYLGFIFEPSSPRAVTAETAASIVGNGMGDARGGERNGWRGVGVFVRQSVPEIVETMRRTRLEVVQLHRRAKSDEVAALRAAGFEVWTLAGGARGDGVLFDSSHGDGDTAFARGPYKAILAGGIGASNVASAIALAPDVIDVNSSLETSPGIKSIALLREFMSLLPPVTPHERTCFPDRAQTVPTNPAANSDGRCAAPEVKFLV